MRAAWYKPPGPATEVLRSGIMSDPEPGPGEVRVRIGFSGVDLSDGMRRGGVAAGATPAAMPFRWVAPNQDGPTIIDQIDPCVDPARVGRRVSFHRTCYRSLCMSGVATRLTPARAISMHG